MTYNRNTVTNPFTADSAHTIVDAFFYSRSTVDAWQWVLAGTTKSISLQTTAQWSGTVKHGYLYGLDPNTFTSCFSATPGSQTQSTVAFTDANYAPDSIDILLYNEPSLASTRHMCL